MIKSFVIRVPEECYDAIGEIQKLLEKRVGFAPTKEKVFQMAVADYYSKQSALCVESVA